MTETVILVFDDQTVDLGRLADFAQSVGTVSNEGNVLTIRRGDERCYVVEVSDPEVEGIFEDWPRSQLPESLRSIFSVDYREPDLVLTLVRSVAQRCSLKVDTNRGLVVRGGDLNLEDVESQVRVSSPILWVLLTA
ncbi:hypothetical protein [Micromonospora sp. AKA38]|uniref:hypothetical protein n=1 Tax=Micromonospora sp. AKA38 TaxID=2733861 RepID=UPI0024936AC6|nr:hypothetical protein [Micromonospora sp. AKA38]